MIASRLFSTGAVLAMSVWLCSHQLAHAGKEGLWQPWPKDSYYKTYPQFHQFPDETGKKAWAVYRLGPVGIGIDLTMPAFGMKVRNVEEGSPAAATGMLKPGQIIETINGRKLEDIDPRVLLGNIITKAEATDGKVLIRVKDSASAAAKDVVVQIPVLGAYSATWPLNCPKSDKIVRGVADYLAKHGNPYASISHDQSLLFLLSTGEEQDLAVAREWVRMTVEKYGNQEINSIPWAIGYGGSGLCEYYLRTGDASVLPLIKKLADQAARVMYNGGWNQRTKVNFKYGHLNAAGVHCVKFFMLAKECGVEVDDYAFDTSLRHFFRFAGRGNVPYGDGLPEGGFVDNGKVGGLAFAMAAAASLSNEGEKSVYAKARDICAVKSFYSTSWMLHGHTGGGIGEIWRSSAMALMHGKKPTKCREFLDARAWHLDLSRRFDGSMCILRDTDYSKGYDNEMWGAGYAMTYTIPRKTLRMTGAPPSKFSHKFELPVRPWGTAADDVFYSLDPAPGPNGESWDVDSEQLVSDASWPLLRKIGNPDATDETLLQYTRHPDYNVRQMAAQYIREGNRDHLIMPLLKASDPRVRHAGVMVIWTETTNVQSIGAERLTKDMIAALTTIIADPNEAWWTVQNAMAALSLAPPEKIAASLDVLLRWLQNDEWWMRRSAVKALTPLVTDSEYAPKIIPALAQMAANNTVGGAVADLPKIVADLGTAKPAVKELAKQHFVMAYEQFPVDLKAPGGADMQNAVEHLHGGLASAVASLPGGFDELYRASRKVLPNEALAYKHLYFKADFKQFGPELRKAMPAIVQHEVIPEFLGSNLQRVPHELNWRQVQEPAVRQQWAIGALDEVAELYREIDIHDYDWHTFGPERDQIKWDYTTFDAPAVTGNINQNGLTYIDRLSQAQSRHDKAVQTSAAASARLADLMKQKTERLAVLKGQAQDKLTAEAAKLDASIQQQRAKLAEAQQAEAAVRAEWQQGMLVGHLPKGMENWFAADFNPARARWQSGRAPFANVGGELKPSEWSCKGNFCGCGETPHTLWEKDVLLMRTTLKVPPLKPDHRYRILVGGNIHSKQGAPVTIYVDGRPVHQQGGFGGRLRGQPRGCFIDKRLADEAFSDGVVTIGVAALRHPQKAFLTCWIEEMKMPPIGADDLLAARTRAPMLCSEWQELQDPEVRPEDPNDGKFRYSGRFVDNPAVHGTWQVVSKVDNIEDFTGDLGNAPAELLAETLTFKSGGQTADPGLLWSDNVLLALTRQEALAMTLKQVAGKTFLFVECGGFDAKHPKGWQSPWFVLLKKR